MLFSTIFLATTLQQDLPVGLALSIVPLILGWLIAFFWHNVPGLKEQIAQLNIENKTLTDEVAKQDEEITDFRVKLTQADSENFTLTDQLKDWKRKYELLEIELKELKEPKAKAKKGE